MIIIYNTIFAIIIGLGNGWIALQLRANKVTDERLDTIFKSQWHNYMMLPLRILVPFIIAQIGGNFVSNLIIGYSIQLLTYDTFIEAAKKNYTFKYAATCEGVWDFWDCLMLKLPLNHLVFKSIIVITAIIYFKII